ncbi:MAG: hypothetical protein NVS9B3_00040 [Gemmatimonadaceae bacterium]
MKKRDRTGSRSTRNAASPDGTPRTKGDREAKRGVSPNADRAAAPSDEEIRQRAYDLYLSRGGESGNALDDWFQAEQSLLAERAGGASER